MTNTMLGTDGCPPVLYSIAIKQYIRLKQLCLALVLTLLTVCQIHAAENEILWGLENFEPFFLLDGPKQGKGLADDLTQFLVKRMPEYTHHFEYMPILRITDSLKTAQPIAVQAYLRNPDDKGFALYTLATIVVPPLELTLRRVDWKQHWDSAPLISLEEFLERGFLLGIAGRRYYNDVLTPILNKPDYKHPPFRVQSSHYRSLVDMITRGRIDATIGYSIELNHYNDVYVAKKKSSADELVSIPFSEELSYIVAYVVLPKSEWGYKVQKCINSILAEQRLSEEYLSILYNWFGYSKEYEEAIKINFNTH